MGGFGKNILKSNLLFARKNKLVVYGVLVLVIFIVGLYLWNLFLDHLALRTNESFGADNKLGLSYIYNNKVNNAGLKIFTLNDNMINSNSNTVYIPQIATANNDDIINSPVIDMSYSNNLYVVIQPYTKIIGSSNTQSETSTSPTPDFGWKNNYKDQFPVSFNFKIRIDLLLNSNYVVDLIEPTFNVNTVIPIMPAPVTTYTYTSPTPGSVSTTSTSGSTGSTTTNIPRAMPKKSANYVPNKMFTNKNKAIGLINLGNNSLHIYGEGDILDENKITYGTVTRQQDDTKDPSYLIFEISITNLSRELNSIVFNFGSVFPFSSLGGGKPTVSP